MWHKLNYPRLFQKLKFRKLVLNGTEESLGFANAELYAVEEKSFLKRKNYLNVKPILKLRNCNGYL